MVLNDEIIADVINSHAVKCYAFEDTKKAKNEEWTVRMERIKNNGCIGSRGYSTHGKIFHINFLNSVTERLIDLEFG